MSLANLLEPLLYKLPLSNGLGCVMEFVRRYRSIIRNSGYEEQRSGGFRARPGAPAVALRNPIQWTHQDRNVEFNLNAWRFLSAIWGKWLQTKNSAYLEEALGHIHDWREHSRSKRRWSIWYDMAVGIRASHLALLTDYQRHEKVALPQQHIELIQELSQQHFEHLCTAENITRGNHAVHQLIGLAHLSSALGRSDGISFAEQMLKERLETSFDEFGFCTENSAFYHDYNISLYRSIDRALFPNLAEPLKRTIEKAEAISPWLTDPSGNYFPFGDTEGRGQVLTATNAWVQNEATQVLDLSASGYQVVRTHPDVPEEAATALAFIGTNKTPTHSHADELSFMLYHRGELLITDAGKYTYDLDDWRRFFISDVAHNTAGLEGRHFYPEETELGSASLRPAEFSLETIKLKGSVRRTSNFVHHRTIAISTNMRRICIEDAVEFDPQEKVELRLHLDASVRVDRCAGNKFKLTRDGRVQSTLEIDSRASNIRLVCGDKAADGRITPGWISKRYGEKHSSQSIIWNFTHPIVSVSATINLL